MATPERGRVVVVAGALVAALTTLIFAPSLGGHFLWDDWTLIVHNAYAHDLSHLGRALTTGFWDVSSSEASENSAYRGLYRPVVRAVQLVEYRFFGERALGYHAVNIALHAVNAFLAFLWLRRRVGGGGRDDRVLLAAAIGAAVFALHPTRPESVTWISGIPDVLMTAFALGGLLLLDDEGRRGRIALSCVLFALATLSKEPAVLLPGIIAIDVVLLRDESESPLAAMRRRRVSLIAATLSVVVAFSLRFAFLDSGLFAFESPADAATRGVASLGHYVLSTINPITPSVHPAIRLQDTSHTSVYAPAAMLLGAAVIAGAAVLGVAGRRRAQLRPWLADACFFLIPLLPVLNLVSINHYSLTSERFLYLPHLGVAALVSRGLMTLSRGPARFRGAVAVSLLVLLGFAVVTYEMEHHLRSGAALWAYEHEIDPDNVVATRELAVLAEDDGRTDDALALLLEAHATAGRAHDRNQEIALVLRVASLRVAALPDSEEQGLREVRDFYAAVIDGRPAALDVGDRTLVLEPSAEEHRRLSANIDSVRVPYCIALLRTHEVEHAIEELEALVARSPRSVGAWQFLALARARQNDFDAALAAVSEAESIMAGHPRLAQVRAAIEQARAQHPSP